jgi:hypothetical protein
MSRFESEGAGKGSKYRDVDRKRYSDNYEAIFGKKPLNIMKEKEDEEAERTEAVEDVELQSRDQSQTK